MANFASLIRIPMKTLYRLLFASGVCLTLYLLAYSRPLTPKPKHTAIIGFYNVENLFDTLDDPLKEDEEFTPGTEKDWNAERYQTKLDRIAEVFSALGGDEFPAVMGLSEVENLAVLQDLCAHEALKKAKYEPILVEGPDQRGIDVGFVYSRKKFKAEAFSSHGINTGEGERPTRDILYVKGKLKRGPVLHILVNHWPSRYGGAEETEPKRISAAEVLRALVDSISRVAPDEGIICLGDFNDYPNNRSIRL
jgi:predicted extracellular nuclease